MAAATSPSRAAKAASLAAILLLSLAASDAPDQQWGPNGNGTLVHSDDQRWIVFRDASIQADNARGVYVATFGSSIRRFEGRRIVLTGYMLPVEATTLSAHFVLTRRSTGCPFCPPNEPSEAIEVFAVAPVPYTQAPVTITGTLQFVAQSAGGLFYRMTDARAG